MRRIARKMMAFSIAVCMLLAYLPAKNVQAAQNKNVTVRTQAELKKALKSGAKNITISTKASGTITVPSGDYGKVKLTVKAKNLTINNKGNFKSVTISDAKKFSEYAKGNDLSINDKSLKLVVTNKAADTAIKCNAKNAKIAMTLNGKVENIVLAKATTLNMSGSTKSTVKVENRATGSVVKAAVAAKIDSSKPADIQVNAAVKVSVSGKAKEGVTIAVNASGAKVTTSVSADVSINADAKVTVAKGAEDTKITVENKDANVDISNKTDAKIEVADSEGNVTSVEKGGNTQIGEDKIDPEKTDDKQTEQKPENQDENKNNSSGAGSGGSTSGGSSSSNPPANVPVTGITASGTPVTVDIKETKTLSYTITPSNATNRSVTWTSSSESIVTVANGVITGVAEGTATITATTVDGAFSCAWGVTVRPAPTSITIFGAPQKTVYAGDQFTLSATVAPTAATQTVTWSSSDTSVATIDETTGVVTAVSSGSVEFTATSTKNSSVTKKTDSVTIEERPEDAKTVTFKVGDTTYQTVTITSVTTLGEIKPSKAPAKTGYTFMGWNETGTEDTGLEDTTSISTAANMTYYAVFEINKYTVTYNTNGGSEIASVSGVAYNTAHTLAGAPTRTGYDFMGWATVSGATAKEFDAGASYTVTGAVTFYAVWKIQSYTITLQDSASNSGKIIYSDVDNASSGTLSTEYHVSEKVTINFTIADGYYLSALNVNVATASAVNAISPVAFGYKFNDGDRTGSISVPKTANVVVTPEVRAVAVPSIKVSTNAVTWFEGDAAATISVSDSTTAADKGEITYQWYQASSASEDGTAVDSATSTSYSLPAIELDNVETNGFVETTYYYCVATNTKDGSKAETKSDVITVKRAVKQVTSLEGLETGKRYVLVSDYTVSEDKTIEAGVSLYIPANVTLTVSNNATLTANGTIVTTTNVVENMVSGARLMSLRLRSYETENPAGKIEIVSVGNKPGYKTAQGSIAVSASTVLQFSNFNDLKSEASNGLIVNPSMQVWVGGVQYIGKDGKITLSENGRVGWFTNGDGKLCLCILDNTVATVSESVGIGLIIVKGTDGMKATFDLGSWKYFSTGTELCIENQGTLLVGENKIVSPNNVNEPLFWNFTNDDSDNNKGLIFKKQESFGDRISVNYCHSNAGTVTSPQAVMINKDNDKSKNGVEFVWFEINDRVVAEDNYNSVSFKDGVDKPSWGVIDENSIIQGYYIFGEGVDRQLKLTFKDEIQQTDLPNITIKIDETDLKDFYYNKDVFDNSNQSSSGNYKSIFISIGSLDESQHKVSVGAYKSYLAFTMKFYK